MRFQSIVNFTNPNLSKGIKIAAPISGKVLPVEEVCGFNSYYHEIGAGVIIKLEGHDLVSPINGKVLEIEPANGRIIIAAKNNLRFLLELDKRYQKNHGLGIQIKCHQGQIIQIGEPLMTFDLYKIKQNLEPVHLFFILLDTDKFKSIDVLHKQVKVLEDPIFSLVPKPITKPQTVQAKK